MARRQVRFNVACGEGASTIPYRQEAMMNFYTQRHQYTCGIDLHARTMYLCILDRDGQIVFDRNLPSEPAALLKAIEPFREDLVIAAECIFTWYWLADWWLDNRRIHDDEDTVFELDAGTHELTFRIDLKTRTNGLRAEWVEMTND